ncbi:hypothetical protein [Rhodoplanes sp. Z2-YC6860]|uniref:hypothetical protein n=1 Tax=Rhodoplanes sp. Z2-YC6860 TaxID=674703 RepID=UPI00078E9F5F|nr:hypothetical protein [Rhodoplanes sp. Z2-YC6860]AMN43133.1 hypothetical protein RHPLAN_47070 [Rhodoplanes sp. Z2-YC6860]
MKLRNLIVGTGVSAAALFALATSASAAIVCSGSVCWHAKERYAYPPSAHVTIHEDSWKWGPKEKYSWREHEGRGYWRGDAWTDF